ncbi:hypothetical protein ASPWEDRAFT_41468 [Aspergillus wentii DTO 134E9]|uniref:FAD-binding domain-containing protein n=1 Tax=Aspergillus wentii DTO 134E9 TaxID=1073089 RepID=A0A1L9RMT3_ASPWE|nr:uncharacterized protein ASPWEDRAFT_41468 [Aspergillus wentii DTO 134E9]OJJ36259.1 hypothetical protein ASPWEDRAFT_41468 [Aspergillus wentii DTO 134E9]
MPSPRIAIVGGGPAGLTLGVLLHKRCIPFTIFDLRQQPTDDELAKPSGMLDLHEESGIAALTECGLFDQFLLLTGECSEAQKVADKDGTILHEDQGELSERPEIPRHALIQLLSSQLPAESIKWGHKLLSATALTTPSGTETELDFGPHGKHTFDLVVGADGAWSRIRHLLTDVKPEYAEQQLITVTIRHVIAKYPHLAAMVGDGTFTALGMRHGVMTHRGPQDSVRAYIALTTTDEDFGVSSGLANQTAASAKSRLLDDSTLLGCWGDQIKQLVAIACDEETADNPGPMDIRSLYRLPIGASWEHRNYATVIGDAAHLMCPWAGEGVNLAMLDSLLLANAITKAYESAGRDMPFQSQLDPLMKEFEDDMVARCKEKAEETHSNGQMLFGDDGAQAFAEFFRQVYQYAEA